MSPRCCAQSLRRRSLPHRAGLTQIPGWARWARRCRHPFRRRTSGRCGQASSATRRRCSSVTCCRHAWSRRRLYRHRPSRRSRSDRCSFPSRKQQARKEMGCAGAATARGGGQHAAPHPCPLHRAGRARRLPAPQRPPARMGLRRPRHRQRAAAEPTQPDARAYWLPGSRARGTSSSTPSSPLSHISTCSGMRGETGCRPQTRTARPWARSGGTGGPGSRTETWKSSCWSGVTTDRSRNTSPHHLMKSPNEPFSRCLRNWNTGWVLLPFTLICRRIVSSHTTANALRSEPCPSS